MTIEELREKLIERQQSIARALEGYRSNKAYWESRSANYIRVRLETLKEIIRLIDNT